MKQVVIIIEDDEEIKWVDGVLTKIKKNDEPKSIMDRVKSYEDGCKILNKDPLRVYSMNKTTYTISIGDGDKVDIPKHIVALIKLETIIEALNEGWVAVEHINEGWWYPWFYRFDKSNENKYSSRYVVAKSFGSSDIYRGIAFAFADDETSNSFTPVSSRLALKSEELTKYCGKQFIQLWCDYLLE